MRKVLEHFASGALPHAGSNGEVRSVSASGPPKSSNFATGSTENRDSESARAPGRGGLPVSGASSTPNCA